MNKNESLEAYQERIRLALDFIDRSIADEIKLEDVAKAAFFSPYHFHRIFSAIIGETPDDYIRRVRLERAARLLWSHKDMSVSDIALTCGFSGPAVFSRNFRARFGSSPLEWKKNRQASFRADAGTRTRPKHKPVPGLQKIEVEKIPDMHVAFVRHMKGYQSGIENSFRKLNNWLIGNDLISKDRHFIGISADNPHITAPGKCRFYICYPVAAGIQGSGNVGTMIIDGGLCARLEYCGPRSDIEKVFGYFYSAWLPQSGLQPDDRPDYIVYYDGFAARTDKVNIVIFIGVRTL